MTSNSAPEVSAKDIALSIKAWWKDAQYLVAGPRGDHNVFDSEPEFVTQAKQVLGDWEAEERAARGY